ncbi:MAG: hypothetical protein V7704_10775 [Aurantimonas endophytica]|uniref:Uncharacterized protein n=1 Tax=Aurantimonas endophytica TaxID=1522175 RepID=A0A7W6HHN8_9HYPH|nr:hypothetical protein [Aurantimonas endophytica]MBB4005394.1 hypothetical protein [Aurantimonas endophytica]MCO6405948.1 hypothetical protein [Aurantimonas endophytica]
MPTLVAVLMISATTVTYVYVFRGMVIYENFNEYRRKGWSIFTPSDCILYITTLKRGSNAVLDPGYYPELERLRQNWQVVRAEGLELVRKNYFDATKRSGAVGYYDVGVLTFFRYGWVRIYLKCVIKWSADALVMVILLALTVVVGQLLSRLI